MADNPKNYEKQNVFVRFFKGVGRFFAAIPKFFYKTIPNFFKKIYFGIKNDIFRTLCVTKQ